MITTPFAYAVPAGAAQVVELLAANPGARLLAGGQSLLVDLQTGADRAALLIDIGRLPGLAGVTTMPGGGLRIGALTLLADLAGDPRVRAAHPALAQAAAANGDPQVRNRGTAAGNLAAPGRPTDLAVAAIAAGAQVAVRDAAGARTVPAADFARMVADTSARRLLVTHLEVPASDHGASSAFEKIPVRATRYPLCAVAVHGRRHGEGTVFGLRIAACGSTATALRLAEAEAALEGSAGTVQQIRAAMRALPADTFVARPGASAEYLAHLTAVLTARALNRLPTAT
jgi:carbon-monoxide dehydrogenase medium subunit